MWGTCQHSSGSRQADFWGWHRIYLYYFEKVLRWAPGDDTLNLPYWDYTDGKHLPLPRSFWIQNRRCSNRNVLRR